MMKTPVVKRGKFEQKPSGQEILLKIQGRRLPQHVEIYQPEENPFD
jgi:hypothetical protein